LTATDGSLTSAESGSFTISAAAAEAGIVPLGAERVIADRAVGGASQVLGLPPSRPRAPPPARQR
jgi:hypothetical protein